eukprot:CAMPEP_0174344656 /NCGR_PEP_ID=MMETSP0810-20121108/27794_1 /TAXON_ID=73025 ORGANISM="Eutreptiella gymnastica-like, Strain CCMP1594" /NCGR_SAMPLE_ID=MMETSP0810 /ASSEMBLY_ACC=CAM_ASM_000659 /LENGTH=64 /DNA_ID=CAMNT_0015467839 /DNA_START=1413 /DNA_END=1607 /DNA_ORIENTATION=-
MADKGGMNPSVADSMPQEKLAGPPDAEAPRNVHTFRRGLEDAAAEGAGEGVEEGSKPRFAASLG